MLIKLRLPGFNCELRGGVVMIKDGARWRLR